MALTAKQKAFVQEYLIDLNATQAAIRAGYSAKTARKIGQENLTKPDIQKAIQEAMDARAKRTEITADRVLQELAKIGFANITDYLRVSTSERVVERNTVTDAEGNETIVPIFDMVQSVELFDTDGIDRVKMDAVAEICETKYGISLKLHDKVSALEKIGRHLGMFKDKVELAGQDGGPLQVIFDAGMSKDE
ncbi:terminase small subunit [Paenibacillus dendritiformis]|uniref:terminase small subunit n=2 Tax=Paenibacillus dendritiformis TaxID=130049 RepID=UPI001F166F32|nr:terminase small subunit [Paenibacillus dendritiformis]